MVANSGLANAYGGDETSHHNSIKDSTLVANSGLVNAYGGDEASHHNSIEDLPGHMQDPTVERAYAAQLIPQLPQVSTQTSSKDIVNDTLKIIFVGNAYAGKTTIIKRLKEGRNAILPNVGERTIGVNIYEWDPGVECAIHGIATSNFDTQVIQENKSSSSPVDVKFSIWDFAGQNEYLVCKRFVSYEFIIF